MCYESKTKYYIIDCATGKIIEDYYIFHFARVRCDDMPGSYIKAGFGLIVYANVK